jgi:hypothetical protein
VRELILIQPRLGGRVIGNKKDDFGFPLSQDFSDMSLADQMAHALGKRGFADNSDFSHDIPEITFPAWTQIAIVFQPRQLFARHPLAREANSNSLLSRQHGLSTVKVIAYFLKA